jgi:hypothetical protein
LLDWVGRGQSLVWLLALFAGTSAYTALSAFVFLPGVDVAKAMAVLFLCLLIVCVVVSWPPLRRFVLSLGHPTLELTAHSGSSAGVNVRVSSRGAVVLEASMAILSLEPTNAAVTRGVFVLMHKRHCDDREEFSVDVAHAIGGFNPCLVLEQPGHHRVALNADRWSPPPAAVVRLRLFDDESGFEEVARLGVSFSDGIAVCALLRDGEES